LSAITIAAAAFARATRTQVIAVREMGGQCSSAYPNRVSIRWISRRNVTDGHFIA
jgi:hypothetical protein